MNNLIFRYAVREDAALILSFIKELAEYEKLLDEVVATEDLFVKQEYRGKGISQA